MCSYTSSHYGSVLASDAPPSTPFSSITSLARGASAPLPGTVFYPDQHDDSKGEVGDGNIDDNNDDNASILSKYTLGTRPPSELANFGSRSGISRGLFTGPRASAQNTRRDGNSQAHSHESPDARFHAEKFYQVMCLETTLCTFHLDFLITAMATIHEMSHLGRVLSFFLTASFLL